MRVLDKGHLYELRNRFVNKSDKEHVRVPVQTIQFVNKEPGRECDGVTTQEVLRALIDRTRHCNNCLPHPNNERAVYHLRMALVLHEARALERKTEKGDIFPEYVDTGDDGHFAIPESDGSASTGQITEDLDPWVPDWDRKCNHPVIITVPEKGQKG